MTSTRGPDAYSPAAATRWAVTVPEHGGVQQEGHEPPPEARTGLAGRQRSRRDNRDRRWNREREVLKPLLEDAVRGKTGQNLKFDLRVLAHHGVEVDEAQADAVATMVREEMTSSLELSVPLVVEVGKGHNWDEAH